MKKATKSAKKSNATARKSREGRIEKNGVVRPYSGDTLKLWEIADKLASKGSTPVRGDVLAAAEKAGVAPGTASTQFGHWRKFHGITGRVAKPKAAKPAKKTAKPARKPAAPKAPKAPAAPKPPAAPVTPAAS